jgi:hypothetical protein
MGCVAPELFDQTPIGGDQGIVATFDNSLCRFHSIGKGFWALGSSTRSLFETTLAARREIKRMTIDGNRTTVIQ